MGDDDVVPFTAAQDKYETVERRQTRTRSSELPTIHRLVHEYDIRGIEKHLKKHPEDVNIVVDGQTPLHRAARQGAALVAEAIGATGPEHTDNSVGLWAAHEAALHGHDQTAEYLFEQIELSPDSHRPWKSEEELETAISKFTAGNKHIEDEEIAQFSADLIGLTLDELDSPEDVIKWVTHLEGLKNSVLGVKSESWWQKKFLGQRVRALCTYLVTQDLKPRERQIFVKELSVTCDALRLARRIECLRKLNSPRVTFRAMRMEAVELSTRAQELKPNEELWLPLGWKGHAIYLSLRAIPAGKDHPEPTLLIRIDNLGAGNRAAHDRDDDGLVESRAFHLPMSWIQGAGEKALTSFLADVLTAKAKVSSDADDFYAPVARLKTEGRKVADTSIIESRAGLSPEDAQRAQIAGNCSVENSHRGLRTRLGSEKRYEAFRRWELQLANDLVGEVATPQKAFEREREVRDRRLLRIETQTHEPRPVINFLEKVADSSYAYRVAEDLTIEDIVELIDVEGEHAVVDLLEHGMDPELRDEDDRSLLHLAARGNCAYLTTALLERGVSAHVMDKNGDTPLHLAAAKSASASVHVLIEKGADPDRPNKSGQTAREILNDNMRLMSEVNARLAVKNPGSKPGSNLRQPSV